MPARELGSLQEALRALDLARRRPDEGDRPPVSTFPMTRAAEEAMRLDRQKGRAVKRPRPVQDFDRE